MTETNKKEFRFFVKIRKHSSGKSVLANVVYYKTDMTFEFFMKWKWYFEYRAALLRVKEPRAYVEYIHGNYEYILPEDIYRAKLKNLIRAAKSERTQVRRAIANAKRNWSEMFPIEEHPKWGATIAKLEYYQKRLNDLLVEQERNEKP